MSLSQTSVALAAIVFSLTACGGGGIKSEPSESLTLAQQIDMLEKTGQLPLLDRSKDLRGPDADNNGIRDDIDAWITAQPITDPQKKAAQQMARVQQAKILVDLSDKSALQMLGDQSMRAVSCLVDVFKPDVQKGSDFRGHLEAMMANTKERAKQYLAYNRAVSGSSGRLPKGNTCEP
ncbi:hypothetical protein [Hydrogenophaga sp.]|uniref:hypothetical protein n=1 Tax=Hydrogenophaga sp. TaxID=1904254 RepID=UPI002FC85648